MAGDNDRELLDALRSATSVTREEMEEQISDVFDGIDWLEGYDVRFLTVTGPAQSGYTAWFVALNVPEDERDDVEADLDGCCEGTAVWLRIDWDDELADPTKESR